MYYTALYDTRRVCGRPSIVTAGPIVAVVLWLASLASLVFLIIDASWYGRGTTSYLSESVYVVISAIAALFTALTFFIAVSLCTH